MLFLFSQTQTCKEVKDCSSTINSHQTADGRQGFEGKRPIFERCIHPGEKLSNAREFESGRVRTRGISVRKFRLSIFFLASLSPSFKFLLQQSFSGHFGFSFNQRFFSSFIFGTGAGRDVGTGSSENRWDQFGFIFKGGKRGKEVSRGPFIANSIPFSTLNSFLTQYNVQSSSFQEEKRSSGTFFHYQASKFHSSWETN